MKILSIIMMMTLIVSCGNSSDDGAPIGPGLYTSQQADLFIQQLKTKAPYKVGQTKMIYEDLVKKISSSVSCSYWEDRTIEITDVQETTIEVTVDSQSTLREDQNSACPDVNPDDFTKSKTMTKEEYDSVSSRFVKFYIDHNFRCSEMKSACISSTFISSTDEDLKGIPTVKVISEYSFNDGTTGELTTWVSKRNLFEGVLKYKLLNKETKTWWAMRGFLSAFY
jgi:hypothetical protein